MNATTARIGATLTAMLVLVACVATRDTGGESAAGVSAEFAPIAGVLFSPRCANCHTVTQFPRQGDDRHPHRFNVQRGPDDHGVPAQRCSSCHSDHNQVASGVPGAPRWGLAPLRMGWETATPLELCRHLKDPARNGGRTEAQVAEHMTGDPLVQWAWEPGGNRTPPPLTRAEFRAAVDRWLARGARC